ncbi:MAG TPA: type II secretion system protein, partial [Patescibacteria group bacterium]|nr:type II secretion system protein [Patescibacteria group bacterium]
MLKLIDSNDGFTIIEVLIVLTIAAFIILIVLLAVPALERASRNNSHKQAAVYILQAYSDWIDQNGISNFGEHGFSSWYVDCGNLPASTSTFCMTLKSAFSQRENNILAYGAISAPPPQWPPLPTNDQLILSDFAKC